MAYETPGSNGAAGHEVTENEVLGGFVRKQQLFFLRQLLATPNLGYMGASKYILAKLVRTSGDLETNP